LIIQNELKKNKESYKSANSELSRVKEQLEIFQHKFEAMQRGKGEDALASQMIEEEENSLIKNLKDCKREHKALIEKVKTLKTSILDEEQNIKQVEASFTPSASVLWSASSRKSSKPNTT
jgi:predicted  nucleic acid-binding Zn-ribbon protein